MPLKNYTGAEYRRLNNPILNEGGWALEDNPNHNYYNTRSLNGVMMPILLIGMHITVGIHDAILPDASANNTVKWGSTTSTKASWHVCVDSDSIIPCLRDSRTAWVQGVSGYNFNRPGLGIEIGTDKTDWRNKSEAWTDAALTNAAIWVAPRVMQYNIPLRYYRNRDTIQGLINLRKPVGFAAHGDLDPTNRTDPGLVYIGGGKREDTFPWMSFLGKVETEVNRRKGIAPEPLPVPPPPAPKPPEGRSEISFWIGATGDDVRDWQRFLARVGKDVGDLDGKFGAQTDAATKEFQRDNDLTVDGKVGPDTLRKKATISTLLENRVAGENRYHTAVLTSQRKGWAVGTTTVYLSADDSLADYTGAASQGDGPVFPVRRGGASVASVILTEIARLKPRAVATIGGKESVTDSQFYQALNAAGVIN